MYIVKQIKSNDGLTTKFLQMTQDRRIIETTLVDHHNKNIICFSTLIGCPIGCKFCVSGSKGIYIRPLTMQEMHNQCINVMSKVDNFKPILFSAMGEGEPFVNFIPVMNTLLKLKSLFQHTEIKLAVSTSGYNPEAIELLSRLGLPIKLQFSLHHCNDSIRKILIPSTGNLIDIHTALRRFNNGNVEVNYILMDNFNDTVADMDGLEKWKEFPIRINNYNTFPGCQFKESTRKQWFIDNLRDRGIEVEVYQTNGSDIYAACGQMSFLNNLTGEEGCLL